MDSTEDKLGLESKKKILRLHSTRGYLQVLLQEFVLVKEGDGVLLEVEVDYDSFCITGREGKTKGR